MFVLRNLGDMFVKMKKDKKRRNLGDGFNNVT